MDKIADFDAETHYLAAVIAEPGWLAKQPVRPAEMASESHAAVLQIVSDLFEAGEDVKFTLIRRELERRGATRHAHAYEAASRLGRGFTLPPWTAPRIRELAIARRYEADLETALAHVRARKIDDVRKIIATLASEVPSAPDVRIEPIEASCESAFELLYGDAGARPLSTGLDGLDDAIGGWFAGDMGIIGADTSVGKTNTLLAMADALSLAGKRVGFIECEDPRTLLGARGITRRGLVSTLRARRVRVRGGSHDPVDIQRAAVGVDAWKQSGVTMAYASGADDVTVCETMQRLVRDHGAELLLVDYVQTINPSTKTQSRKEDIRLIASRIKATASRLGVPVVVASQLARRDGGDHREPSKHDLKECGDLENMAEVVLLLWRTTDDPTDPNFDVIAAKVAKAKAGGAGTRFSLRIDEHGALREKPPRSMLYEQVGGRS